MFLFEITAKQEQNRQQNQFFILRIRISVSWKPKKIEIGNHGITFAVNSDGNWQTWAIYTMRRRHIGLNEQSGSCRKKITMFYCYYRILMLIDWNSSSTQWKKGQNNNRNRYDSMDWILCPQTLFCWSTCSKSNQLSSFFVTIKCRSKIQNQDKVN